MNVENVIQDALIHYDNAQPVIRYLLRNTGLVTIRTTNDTQRTTFQFTDKESKKTLFETEVEILAVFYDKLNIWSWAWSQVGLYNSENYLAKEMLLHALKLGSELSYIKSIITTSRGILKDSVQIDINLAIGSSIIKQPYIYPYIYSINENSLVYYFILLNKPELEKLNKKLESQNGKIEPEFIDE